MVVITGTSSGIGLACAIQFVEKGFEVAGLDIQPQTSKTLLDSEKGKLLYKHYLCDVTKPDTLPDLRGVTILVNNAGTQTDADAIEVNLQGVINCTEKYGLQPGIWAILNVASTSGHNGAEFPRYAASKGGVLAYTKNVAMEVAKYGAVCNSISPGGVFTPINDHIVNNSELWQKVMDETPLRKWASVEEIAEWVYFLTATQHCMTGQDVIVDNGEMAKFNFVW